MGQITLLGEPADERKIPQTLIHCRRCGENVLKSRVSDHPHPIESPEDDDEDGEEDTDIGLETQGFRVEYVMEYVEVVHVSEATDKWDAKEIAEHTRDHRGEYMGDIHTTVRALGEPSEASEDYLKRMGHIPNDD